MNKTKSKASGAMPPIHSNTQHTTQHTTSIGRAWWLLTHRLSTQQQPQHNTGCHCSPCRPPCPANTSTTTTTPPIPHCLAANTSPPPHMARFMLVVAVPQTQQTTWLCAHHPSTPQTIPHSLVLSCVAPCHPIHSMLATHFSICSSINQSTNKSTSSNNNNNNNNNGV